MFVCDYGKIKLICGILIELLTFKHNENFCKLVYRMTKNWFMFNFKVK